MPTYDFVCPSRHEFERFFRKISDAPMEVPCPECGAIALRKVSGGAGLVFKGSGFYITDYGKDGKGPKKSPESEAASARSEAKSEGKAEPKAEAKPKAEKPAAKKAAE